MARYELSEPQHAIFKQGGSTSNQTDSSFGAVAIMAATDILKGRKTV